LLFAIFKYLFPFIQSIVISGLIRFLIIALLSGLWPWACPAQSVPGTIRLKTEQVSSAYWDYYIDQVIDERVPGQLFANIWYLEDGLRPKSYPSDIAGGSTRAISDFLLSGLVRNTSGTAINIRILECKIRETNQSTNVSGQVILKLQFEFQKSWGIQPLTTYSTSLKYTRSIHKSEHIEPALRSVLGNSLKFIQNWVKKEAATNIVLAKGVKLSFSDYQEDDPDTVYYHKSRPLDFNDFKAKTPQNTKYQAAIFPSFGYDMRREFHDGMIEVRIDLKVYMVKSASWASPMVKNPYSLNHEQRHFDLVKLIAERFRKKLASENLTPDNYEGIINFEYLEFYRQMNQLQEKYDEETGHGTNRIMQTVWNKRIDQELQGSPGI
jgi:hypothetical protein